MPHYPTCTFCGESDSKPSKEHVLPKWIAREFPDVGTTWKIINRKTEYPLKQGKYINITTRHPCQRCNNGWMSELENEAKPILTPLLHGKPSTLTFREQQVIGIWYVKTAMMYDLHSGEDGSRSRYFQDHEHRRLMSSLSFEPSYFIYIGKYDGSGLLITKEDHVSVAFVWQGAPLGEPVWGYCLTFVIKHLVLQILCVKAPAPFGYYGPDFSDVCVQIGTRLEAINWPLAHNLSDESIDRFSYRWSECPKIF